MLSHLVTSREITIIGRKPCNMNLEGVQVMTFIHVIIITHITNDVNTFFAFKAVSF
jgi:hypothetical protein